MPAMRCMTGGSTRQADTTTVPVAAWMPTRANLCFLCHGRPTSNYGRLRPNGTAAQEAFLTCEGRARFIRSHRWTFYSNEYTLLGGRQGHGGVRPCPQMVSVTIFRSGGLWGVVVGGFGPGSYRGGLVNVGAPRSGNRGWTDLAY